MDSQLEKPGEMLQGWRCVCSGVGAIRLGLFGARDLVRTDARTGAEVNWIGVLEMNEISY
jgi:hypothetical protein